mgnify:CR=1 FL=1
MSRITQALKPVEVGILGHVIVALVRQNYAGLARAGIAQPGSHDCQGCR